MKIGGGRGGGREDPFVGVRVIEVIVKMQVKLL